MMHDPAHTAPATNGEAAPPESAEVPVGTLRNLPRYFGYDVLAGFLVFLIALPLCLAISIASGYPAIAGVFTAIIGGGVSTLLSNSELTIKGPAAGLIVIAIGCVSEFANVTGGDMMAAHRLALSVGVAAAVFQILFALLRTGALGEFFPTSTVHGMMAAIGVIIILKQIPVAVASTIPAEKEPLRLFTQIPELLRNINPQVAVIGFVSLIILFGMPLLKKGFLAKIPAQLVVVLVAIPLGMLFDLTHNHFYTFRGHEYPVGERHLVNVPNNMLSAFVLPDFNGLGYAFAWKWVVMYALIGSLESLLSTKAIDLLDPWKRKTNLDRDMLAVGVGNLLSAFVGGLPMISEIVRSRANIDNGARTRFADLFHSIFLLLCVALIPFVLHLIPLAALAAMLIYTGFRLAHPREFMHVLKVGPEQFLIFVTTIVAVLATDLLVGIGIGIATKFCIHLVNGVPVRSLFKPYLEVVPEGEQTYRINASQSAVFSNWIMFRRQIVDAGLVHRKNVVVDLSETRLVDHTVMEKLHELELDFKREGLKLEVVGLENHKPMSRHPHSARKRKKLVPQGAAPDGSAPVS
jgi:MFS superfamily sulfate permease-like transporter